MFALLKLVVLRRLRNCDSKNLCRTWLLSLMTDSNNFLSAAKHKSAKASRLAGTKLWQSLRQINASRHCQSVALVNQALEAVIANW